RSPLDRQGAPRGQRLRERVPAGALQPQARAKRHHRVPDDQLCQRLPELVAGQGGRPLRRRRKLRSEPVGGTADGGPADRTELREMELSENSAVTEEAQAPERDHRSITELIDHLEYLVHRAQRVPFTHNVMIDEDEILDLLDQIHVNLPEEIKQARGIIAEQERLLSEAQQEAARISQSAAQKAEAMMQEHEVTRRAEGHGQALVREAQARAEAQKQIGRAAW